MRLLSFNIDEKFIKSLEENEFYICDVATDINDAVYHAQVRFYNLILLRENSIAACKEVLDVTDKNNSAVVVITDNPQKEFEIEVLKAGALCVIKEPISKSLIMAKLESIHRENFASRFYYRKLVCIDRIKRSVIDYHGKELNLRGKSFEIFSYLLKNRHRPPISKDEIIDALWDEPEMISQNIVEVNINQIRNEIRKNFNEDFVETIRHRGYKIRTI
jgi:two-component system OmpR family response regulator